MTRHRAHGDRNGAREPGAARERLTPAWRPVQAAKTPPCQAACPNCGDIRGWIAAVAQRRQTGLSRSQAYAQAWRMLTDVNPFPATLGRICPHPCETHCNRGERDEPLSINSMERFLGDHAIKKGLPLARIEGAPRVNVSVGVVGAGPSGLSFAYQMARRGAEVAVYDAREKPGGMLRYGVPDYRLPQNVLDAEIARIIDLGVKLNLNVSIGRDLLLDELRARHDYLYLAIGAQHGRDLGNPGADGPGVWNSSTYLDRVNRGEAVPLGQRVVVVGGGNSAVDAARCARRAGASVTILYRRSLAEMPAITREVEEAVEEGVELVLLAAPVRVERAADGRLLGLQAQHVQPGERDASGRHRPVPIEGATFCLPADCVIAAISQAPALQGFEQLARQGDWLVTDEEGCVAPRLWVGGDVTGPGIASEAIYAGRRVAERLCARLCGNAVGPESGRHAEISPANIRFESRPHSAAVQPERLLGMTRVSKGMREVAATVTEEAFLGEAERCYSCGACLGCEQCFMYCTSGCFVREDDPAPGAYFTLNLDSCRECGKCIEVCPCGYLEAR